MAVKTSMTIDQQIINPLSLLFFHFWQKLGLFQYEDKYEGRPINKLQNGITYLWDDPRINLATT